MARSALGAASLPFQVGVGTGVGGAIAGALQPAIQTLANNAWSQHPNLPIEAVAAAMIVASGERPMDWGKVEALNTGVSGARFEALVDMADEAPALSVLYEMLRRKLIGPDQFRDGARKGMIEAEWIGPLLALQRRLLSPDELANAVVQGFRDQADAAADAELQGVDHADFDTMVNVTGLPPGPETLQEWTRRGIIGTAELAQGIREGHTKVKYIDEYIASLQRVLTAPEYAGLHLRGHITQAEMVAGGALTGFDAESMNLLYLNRGRPATTRQVHIGYARGGTLPGAASERDAFDKAVAQSNIRTEYSDLLWAQRHTYPSAFVIRALVQDGTFTEAEGRQILIESGWRPDYAAKVAAKWAGASAGPTADKWLTASRTRLFTTAHSEFMVASIDEGQARAALSAVGATGAAIDSIIGLWDRERTIFRRELTPAQLRKLYKAGVRTEAEALQTLDDWGYEPDDASDFLQT